MTPENELFSRRRIVIYVRIFHERFMVENFITIRLAFYLILYVFLSKYMLGKKNIVKYDLYGKFYPFRDAS